MKTYLNIDAIPDGSIPSTKLSSGSGGGGGAYREVLHGTNDTTFILTPNIFHVWDEVTELTLTLDSETSGMANEYLFQFTSGSEPTVLSLPDDIKWVNDEAPVIEANKIYQISILKGLGSVMSWENVQLINFTIIGTEYQAEEGMTWEEFINSEYNTGNFVASETNVRRDGELIGIDQQPVLISDNIINGMVYGIVNEEEPEEPEGPGGPW